MIDDTADRLLLMAAQADGHLTADALRSAVRQAKEPPHRGARLVVTTLPPVVLDADRRELLRAWMALGARVRRECRQMVPVRSEAQEAELAARARAVEHSVRPAVDPILTASEGGEVSRV